MEHDHLHHHSEIIHTHPVDPRDSHHQNIEILGEHSTKGVKHKHFPFNHEHPHTHDDPHHAHEHTTPERAPH